jgi:hypothetical protein
MPPSPVPRVSSRSREYDRFKAELSLKRNRDEIFFSQMFPMEKRQTDLRAFCVPPKSPMSIRGRNSDVPRAPCSPCTVCRNKFSFPTVSRSAAARSPQTTAAESRKPDFPSANAVAAVLIKPHPSPEIISENYISRCKMYITAVTI